MSATLLPLREPESEKYRAIRRARTLRRRMTDAELILWSRLRARQLEGFRFRRQHPVAPYIADFACVAMKLIVEVDGGTHGTPDEIAHDRRRTRFLEAKGWTIVRCYNVDVYSNLGGVLIQIAEALINLERAARFPSRFTGEGDRAAVEGPARGRAAVSGTKVSPQPAAAAPSTRTMSGPLPRRGGEESAIADRSASRFPSRLAGEGDREAVEGPARGSATVSGTNPSPQPVAAAPSARTSSAPLPRRGGEESAIADRSASRFPSRLAGEGDREAVEGPARGSATVSGTNPSPQPVAAAPSARTSSAPLPRRGGEEKEFVDKATHPKTGKDVT